MRRPDKLRPNARVPILCLGTIAAICLLGPVPADGARKFVIPPTPFEARPGDLHAFYGQVVAVDRAARTVTLGLPMRFTFRVPEATPIALRKGAPVAFAAIQPGAGLQIVAVRETNGWRAQKITLEPGASFPDEPSVTTVQGKKITGLEAVEFVVYEPPSQIVNRGLNFGHRAGLFLLSIRPDGTVATVRTLKSTGVKELDERASRRLMQMKFRPGALKEARLPVTFDSFRRR